MIFSSSVCSVCIFRTKLKNVPFKNDSSFENLYAFSDADSDDALQDNKHIGLSCIMDKVI